MVGVDRGIMHRLPVVYIAGPYRAPTPWQIQENIRRAQSVALTVWKLGAVAICPHANTALFDGEADDSMWLEGDLELLRRSDAVCLVPGWDNSQGASAEYRLALELGMPTFDSDFGMLSLQAWVTQWKTDIVASTASNSASV